MLDGEAWRVYLYSMNLNDRLMTAGVAILLVLAFTVEAAFGPWWQKVLWFAVAIFVASGIVALWIAEIIREGRS